MQCFTVRSDEIQGRVDPLYLAYSQKGKKNKSKFEKVALEKLLTEPPQYGANETAVDGNPETDIRYIRITDINEFGLLNNDCWKTAKNIEERYLLKPKDILFARSGATAGKCLIVKQEYGNSIFAGYCIRFRIDEKKANPFFIFYLTQLQFYFNWVRAVQRLAGQPNINAEEYKALEIPLPPFTIQAEIVAIMNTAYEMKGEKEAEAEQLLTSIDSYVLEKLDIEMSNFENRMYFTVKSDEVEGGRFDTYYYQPKFEFKIQALKRAKYGCSKFRNMISDLKNGVELRKYSIKGYRYLRVTDLDSFGINDNDPRFVDVNEIPDKVKLNKGDFLISRSGSLGLVAAVTDKIIDSIISSHIFKVTLNTKHVNLQYLESFFRSTAGQFQFFQNNNGGIIPEIAQEALKNLLIVLPPIEVQNEIAAETQRRMNRAKQLNEEAITILEEAKKRVEQILF